MPAVRKMEIAASNLVFDCDVAGSPQRGVVLLLHGFPQTSHTWRRELPALSAAGYLAVAPNQRGYSPRARPLEIADYAVELLMGDALAIADCVGAERFHLVGHDWGGQLAWLIAAHRPERVRSLCVLSRPHPAAFIAALQSDSEQSNRSRHHSAFQDPNTARRMLEDNAKRLRTVLSEQGVASADVDAYLERLNDEAALNAALNWYRSARSGASPLLAADVPAIEVPTLYLWGDADSTVGRIAAEGTANHVSGPFQFQILPGAGHFLTDQAGPQVTDAILTHIQRHGG
jgi:pimeloyl-ACP methyl ester carboxylesterase